MPRLRVILLVSLTCAGCASLGPTAPPSDAGRTLRLLVADRAGKLAVAHALVSRPALETEGKGGRIEEPGCFRFELPQSSRGVLGADAVVAHWERGLREADGPRTWLLAPVTGTRDVAVGASEHARGLIAEDDAVVVCVDRATPDWSARLAHPALWPETADGAGGGPFRRTGAGDSLVRTSRSGRRLGIERVELVSADPHGDMAAPTGGRFDLGVLHGRAADGGLERDTAAWRTARLPGWDTVYALWLNQHARWTNDPTFRTWLAAVLDRDSMARYLFGRQAEATFGLLDPARRPPAPPARRPFSESSSPRLRLSYDQNDRAASSLSARIKAVLEREGVEIRLEPRTEVGTGDASLSLLAHRPPVDDPLLGLLDTFWPLAGAEPELLRQIDRATRVADLARRRERALAIESQLAGDARCVPLVRVHAWLVTRSTLRGIEAGPFGVLRLERAEWRP